MESGRRSQGKSLIIGPQAALITEDRSKRLVMEYKISETAGVVLIRVEGNILGGPDASQLNDEVHRLLKENRRNFVVNVQSVDLINSSGLGILISNLTHVKNNGGDLRISNVTPKVKQILTMTKLVNVFKVFDTEEEAIASFR
jgi:anti-sigma B factor antagonist